MLVYGGGVLPSCMFLILEANVFARRKSELLFQVNELVRRKIKLIFQGTECTNKRYMRSVKTSKRNLLRVVVTSSLPMGVPGGTRSHCTAVPGRGRF